MKVINFIIQSLDEKICGECGFSDECKKSDMCLCDTAINKLTELTTDLGEL